MLANSARPVFLDEDLRFWIRSYLCLVEGLLGQLDGPGAVPRADDAHRVAADLRKNVVGGAEGRRGGGMSVKLKSSALKGGS